MELAEALGESSLVEHISGKASVQMYEDMHFSIFTIGQTSFLIGDLASGQTSINGTPYDLDEAKAIIEQALQAHGLTFESGWHPRQHGKARRSRPEQKTAYPGIFELCLMVICVLCWVWPWIARSLGNDHSSRRASLSG